MSTFIWGTTSDWAGNGSHKKTHMSPETCCANGNLKRMRGGSRGDHMLMTDRDTGETLEIWQCNKCWRVWFRRPGMTGFFMIQPVIDDPFA